MHWGTTFPARQYFRRRSRNWYIPGMKQPLMRVCPTCSAMRTAMAPHGEGEPCPWQVELLQAQRRVLEGEMALLEAKRYAEGFRSRVQAE